MKLNVSDFSAIRASIAAIPSDVSNDAVGANAPKLEDIYAPETHAVALDPATPIVVGARGAGKSFWAGVLGQPETREAAAQAYPKLGLERTIVHFGFTGLGGPDGVGIDALNANVPPDGDSESAKAFWWATVLRAAALANHRERPRLQDLAEDSRNWEVREDILSKLDHQLRARREVLVVVYDALDTVATTWARRRLLTEALLEVVWAMRAYHAVKLKLFLRPDQIDDDALRFVELPKLRAGAVRLTWSGTDLYGLLYARLALSTDAPAKEAFTKLLKLQGNSVSDRDAILTRRWALSHNRDEQMRVMENLAGSFMADGAYGYKKGKTYEWPVTHLSDAFDEVTPRSFLGLMIAAARYGAPPTDRVITPDGIRHGLRAASKTRVDQLHQEFPWIKGVLVPLAGLLLPKEESAVFQAWSRTNTIQKLISDAKQQNYLPPFPPVAKPSGADLFEAMRRIGVMFRRKDGRLDMPDLFRIASKLLKKGQIAPL